MTSPSLTLQILFYLSSFYFGMFVILEIGVLAFKGLHLPYPEGGLWVDAVVLFLLTGTEAFRIMEGQKGNVTSSKGKVSIVVSMGMCAPAVLAVLYFVLWQHFVLRIELILGIIQLCLQISQFFISFGVLTNTKLNT